MFCKFSKQPVSKFMLCKFSSQNMKMIYQVQCGVPKAKKQKVTTYMVRLYIYIYIYIYYLHCEIHHKSPYNLRFAPVKVLEKSLVLIRQNLWEQWYLILQIISVIDGWGISCELALRWMPHDLTDDNSTLVQVMAWCRQATSLGV